MTRSASQRYYVARLALILAMVFVTSVGLVRPALAHGGTTFVRQGQSIQAAIDAARPGDRIVVGRGTYAEQLTVSEDGIELVGLGAILVPPSSPVVNLCSGLAGPDTEAGICVTGADVVLAPFVGVEHRKVVSVGRRVENVSIAGFNLRGFSGENVAVVGAQDARVIGNRLTDGARYGLLTVGSTNTRAFANIVGTSTTLPFIGICADDVAGTVVSRNHISGYNIAICVQTPGEAVLNNDVSASCTGVFVDPGIDGAKIRDNHIKGTNPRCRDENAPFFVVGIGLSGAVNTEVRRNRVEGQTAGGLPNGSAAGLIVVDDSTTGAVPSGNVVTQNTLINNDLDLFVRTAGTGNVIKHNKCTTSNPPGLCG